MSISKFKKSKKRHSRVYGSLAETVGRGSINKLKKGLSRPRLKLPKLRRQARVPWFFLVKLGLLLAAACFVLGTIAVVWISRDLQDPNQLGERKVSESTKIYDRTGEHLLFEIFQNQKRTIVELEEIAPQAINATVAIEDKGFYEHKGIRLRSIVRATVNNLIGRRTGSGGASTMTQQLIKNTIVGDERSIFRKVKEAILAVQLERKYSKDEIMKLYLNEIPYGSTNYGIESASQSYFKKNAIDLTLAEAATLAALPKAPSRYLNNLEALKDRRDVILRLMNEQGYITELEKEAAQLEEIKIFSSEGIFSAPHFVLYVKQLLADKYGEKTVDSGGLKVITTLDFDKQQLAEQLVKENGDKFAEEANANNASLVAMDPRTGQILSMVGSRDFENDDIDGKFNVAVLGRRQPGSSFKPVIYAAAFEKGFTPNTVLYDVKTDFDATGFKEYIPKNYDGKERGIVTMRQALQGSLNIPAVKTMYLVGETAALNMAQRLGYTRLTGDYGLTLVLGGGEVSLLEHTNAYATFANQGTYNEPISILKVENGQGDTLFEWKPSPGEEVIDPKIVATLTNILTDNNARAYIFGLQSNLVVPGYTVAAKTGTTNNVYDTWTMGYTPSLAAGVWVGNTNPSEMKGASSRLAGAIWNGFMRGALAGTAAEEFPEPPELKVKKAVLRGSVGGIKLQVNKLTGNIATSSTPANFIAEKTFLPPHTILHYVNKDNPDGDFPEDPTQDPQYFKWEAGLATWVANQIEAGNLVSLAEPPIALDTPASIELIPTVTVLTPQPNTQLNSRDIEIEVEASAPRGITRVTYLIDNTNIGFSFSPPFSLNHYAQKLSPGEHVLKVVAQDDIGTTAIKEIPFTMVADFDPPSFAWLDKSVLQLQKNDFPRAFFITPFRWEDSKNIQIFWDSAEQTKLIYTFIPSQDKPTAGQLFFNWNNSPAVGRHRLRAVMNNAGNQTMEKELEIEIK